MAMPARPHVAAWATKVALVLGLTTAGAGCDEYADPEGPPDVLQPPLDLIDSTTSWGWDEIGIATGTPPECDPETAIIPCEPECGDTRDIIIQEYVTFPVSLEPDCSEFASSGGTAHFSWSELNGGFHDGNPHNPWGMIKASLTNGLEATRSHYNRGGIVLTSGYRCPHGNSDVGGKPQSRHMFGDAADFYSAQHPWNQTEWNLLANAADDAGASFIEPYEDDPSHVHADWR